MLVLPGAMAVAEHDMYVVFPKQCSDAHIVSAYAMKVCKQSFERMNWSSSILAEQHRLFVPKYSLKDFYHWVQYGSWTNRSSCGAFFFNAEYFTQTVYQDQSTSSTADLHARYLRTGPTDPLVHAPGDVGYSSRWWYLPGMYTPVVDSCKCCTGMESEGAKAIRRMSEARTGHRVSKTAELYRMPWQGDLGNCAVECIGWPRYDGSVFR